MYGEYEFQEHDTVSVKGKEGKFDIRFIEDDYAVVRDNEKKPLVVKLADLKHIGKVCTDCKRPIRGNNYYGRCGICEHDAHGR